MNTETKQNPEEFARIRIDKQLREAGWDIVSRDEYVPGYPLAVKEALLPGNLESDYLLFIDNKAVAVIEAKAQNNPLGEDVAEQAENYANHPQEWYGVWFENQVPLVYLANGKKICFKNMLIKDSEYIELPAMHSPKKMLQLIGKTSEYGALPRLDATGLRHCQYTAELNLERKLKDGVKKSLAILATGAGKTYLACLATYRLLNYTSTNRVLFLVDRNNLARQTENEFSHFDRTENNMSLSSLYQINRLRKNEDIQGNVVISTIQKLFAVLTGKQLTEEDEDREDEFSDDDYKYIDTEIVHLGDNLTLSPDYFQFIVVDECHRSIYGKWKSVLDYFKDANILGLTATPNGEALAFFNKSVIEKYTYEDSVIDGVNVPSRVYRIQTNKTEHGGRIESGDEIIISPKKSKKQTEIEVKNPIDYAPTDVNRTVMTPDQIKLVLREYRDSIYRDMYPEREEMWEYIPKTLIFAKSDRHADDIVKAVTEVFGEKFANNQVPDGFVQKITYSAGDSNALIRDLREEKNFRIAVTVTLVATGTDVKPLEVVLFMNDIQSELLYTQMKGRGCRTISADKLREITPNSNGKEWFMVVDAVGVTEHEKKIPRVISGKGKQQLSLEILLEHLAHGEVSDENLALLRDYCATIHNKYENNVLFGKFLTEFIDTYGYSPKYLAETINTALGNLPEFVDASKDNSKRMNVISCLIQNIDARKKLIELKKGYVAYTTDHTDYALYTGFSKESARSFLDSFEKTIEENRDSIEALRIIYNAEDIMITHSMLVDLQEKLLGFNRQFLPGIIWRNYKTLDESGKVDEPDTRYNVNALTHLLQLVRYGYHKTFNLVSIPGSYLQKFNLYCGQIQRELTADQREIMREIAEYIANEGYITSSELNSCNTDLWRKGIKAFTPAGFADEILTLSNFILKVS